MATTSSPLISIIIPTYNRAELIKATLFSIEGQTYKNWECIVVDDGSTDNTRQVIEGFIDRDSRFKFLTNQRTKGAQGARNTGLLSSKGDYIAFFDSDNLMYPNRIEVQVAYLERHAGCDVCTCYSHLVDDEHQITGAFTWVAEGNILNGIINGWTYVDYNSAIIRRTSIDKINLLDENCPSYQEWDTFIQLAQVANFGTVHELLISYYQRKTDRISTDNKRDLRGLAYIYAKHKQLWKSIVGKDSYLLKLHALAVRLAQEDKSFQQEITNMLPELKKQLIYIKLKHKIKAIGRN